MSKVHRITSLLLGLLLVTGCTMPTPPASQSMSPSVATPTPQVELEHNEHLGMLLSSGVLAKSWTSIDELNPDAIVAYYSALQQVDDRLPRIDLTYPKHPRYDNYNGLMYADTVEQVASVYFDATPEHMRKSIYYFPDEGCYELVGLGSVASCAIRYVNDYGSKTIISFDIFWDGAPYADGMLTTTKRTDGSWYYSAFELTKPNVTTEQQEQWNPMLSLLGNGGFLSYSWENGDEVPAYCYRALYVFTRLREPDFRLSDADTLALPAKEFETLMQRQFDVSTEHLRTVSEYDKHTNTYQISGGVGSGPAHRLDSVTEQDGTISLAYIMYAMNGDRAWEGTLTVRQDGNTLRYIGNELRSLSQQAQAGTVPQPNQLAAFEHLTPEQKELYQKGLKYVEHFDMSVGYFDDDEIPNRQPEQYVDANGYPYHEYTGTKYTGWDDFYSDHLTVFTKAGLDRLNTIDFMSNGILVPLYINHNGKLYHLTRDRGGDHTTMMDIQQFSLNLATKDYISVGITTYYQEATSELDGPPISYQTREFILRKTADGWRIARLELPY